MKSITVNMHNDSDAIPVQFYSACEAHIQEPIVRHTNDSVFHQIMFVIDGTGIFEFEDKSFEIKKGSAFLTLKNTNYSYKSTDGLITAFVTANDDVINSLAQYYGCKEYIFYETVNLTKYLSFIREIVNEYSNSQSQGRLSALTYSFFVEFFEERNAVIQSKLSDVILYINNNFTKKLTLDEIADVGKLSRSGLCHSFKSAYNCTVFNYILKLRLNYGRSLLIINRSMPIKEVALLCGFDDVSYFCRAYKAKFGISPKSFR